MPYQSSISNIMNIIENYFNTATFRSSIGFTHQSNRSHYYSILIRKDFRNEEIFTT